MVLYYKHGGRKMDFNLGDLVQNQTDGSVGTVELVDGTAIWVRWFCGRINHHNFFSLKVLETA
tara:strand:+ start:469 stop:657 length:189 start_codon:yes stop_codon:yes gene_type:complete